MNKIEIEEIKLIGLSLSRKTSNQMGQSKIDCGNLWRKFENENYVARIPSKLSNEIIAVYHEYEGDNTQPFSYFIGCKVNAEMKIPEGMHSVVISKGIYQKISSCGKMPDCIANTWKEIWTSDIPRAYRADFEVYDERSKDWNKAEIDVFISIKY
jgi:predicted transcriptional regulator YdeE